MIQQYRKDDEINTSTFEIAIKELITWYINLDESYEKKDENNHELDVKEIYNQDGTEIPDDIKYKIAMDIYFIADAYDDGQLYQLHDKILAMHKKEDAIVILRSIKERLIEANFCNRPISNIQRKGNLINVIN